MFSNETHDAGRDWVLAQILSQYIVGFLGKSDGAGGWTFFVPGRPGKVYCRVWMNDGMTIHEVTNFVAPLEPNLRVWMKYFNDELIVELADPIAARTLYGNNVGAAGVPTYVTVQNNDLVVGLRFLPGRVGVTAPVSLSVNVYDFDYTGGHWSGTTFDPLTGTYSQANNFDLTPYRPATAGDVGWVAVYLNPSDGALYAVAGATLAAGDNTQMLTLSLAAPSPYAITIPASAYPLGAVALASDTTVINESTLFVDLRHHLAETADGIAAFDELVTDGRGSIVVDGRGHVALRS